MVDGIRCLGNEKDIYLTGSGREGREGEVREGEVREGGRSEGGRKHMHAGSN